MAMAMAMASILATMDTIKATEAEFKTAQDFEYHVLMTRGLLALVLRTQKTPIRALIFGCNLV